MVQRTGIEAMNPMMSRIMPRTITPIPPRSRSACLKTASRRSWILAPFVLATDLTVHLFNGVLRFLHERVTLARLIAQFLDRATGSLRIILRMPLVSSRMMTKSTPLSTCAFSGAESASAGLATIGLKLA